MFVAINLDSTSDLVRADHEEVVRTSILATRMQSSQMNCLLDYKIIYKTETD